MNQIGSKKSTAQIGYGEITKGAMQKFITILQNIDKSFKPEHEECLNFSKEEYRLTEDDTFIDIGSGFGKPVFHAALQVGCYSKGIEIVPARVTFWLDFIYVYEEKKEYLLNNEIQRLQKEGSKEVDRFIQSTKSPRKKIQTLKNIWNPIAEDYENLKKEKSNEIDSEEGRIKMIPQPLYVCKHANLLKYRVWVWTEECR